MIKICQECGEEFETTNGMQKFCTKQHYRTCIICGSMFPVTRYHLTAKDAKQTCSKKCSSELRKRTNIDKYGGVAPACSKEVRTKMEATNLHRYGVMHAAQSDKFKEKSKQTNLMRYGVEYYSQTEKSRSEMSNRWQASDYSDNIKQKKAQTNLNRYGYACALSNPDVRNKAKQTYYNKTGYEQPLNNPDVRLKITATNLSKLGSEYPMQSKQVVQKFEATNLEKYGCRNPMQNKEILGKAKITNLTKYGNTCFLQSAIGRDKTRKSIESRYGVKYFSQTGNWKSATMINPSKLNNLMRFREDPARFLSDSFDGALSIKELADILGITESTTGQLAIQFNIQDKIKYVYSYMEDEIFQILKDIDKNLAIERNTHKIITPYELDFYLPEYRVGIECNPTSTHNSTIDAFTGQQSNISYNYHKMKTDMCEDKGIFLFHIFGYEWTHSRPTIESMLRNILSKNMIKYYARNLSVKSVCYKDGAQFLDENHRQHSARSSIGLGLYRDNELLSLMTFGKMRNTIGTGKEDLSDCWELVRFCSKLNTTVVGGASKLFSYFIKTYNPSRIRSFSDRAHTRGTLYAKLGFEQVRMSDPGYVWVDSKTDIAYNRYNAQKQNIKKFLKDETIDLSKTEKQIMEEHGFVQVFDSGTITWEWSK